MQKREVDHAGGLGRKCEKMKGKLREQENRRVLVSREEKVIRVCGLSACTIRREELQMTRPHGEGRGREP